MPNQTDKLLAKNLPKMPFGLTLLQFMAALGTLGIVATLAYQYWR